MYRLLFSLVLFGAGAPLGITTALAQPPPLPNEESPQKGVEVLTRGPLHEAFAEPLTVDVRPNPIIHQKPPAAIEELPPDEKPEGAHFQWIPGYFAWDETGDDYIWISGLWRATPPNRQWMPGHWTTEADGWQWISGYWASEGQADVEYLPPPPASIDVGPSVAAPDSDSLYTPGIWVHQERRYLWRPGFWYRARADWFYNPACYNYTPAGYIFTDGYWDFPVERRGVLFAPVRFAQNVWAAPGWTYQPRYALGSQGLLSTLFVRPEFSRYYFGDYYGPDYNRQGFTPWFDYRMGRNNPDPLFSHSRWSARADAQWEGKLRGLHKDRYAGNAARPPITLVKQREFLHNVSVGKRVQIGNNTINVTEPHSILAHIPLVAPVHKIEQKQYKYISIPKSKAVEERKAAQLIAAAAQERQKLEAELRSKRMHSSQPADPPARVKFEHFKNSAAPRAIHVTAPSVLVVPKHVEKAIPKHEPVKPVHVKPPPHKGKGKDKDRSSLQLHRDLLHAAANMVFGRASQPGWTRAIIAATLTNARRLM